MLGPARISYVEGTWATMDYGASFIPFDFVHESLYFLSYV